MNNKFFTQVRKGLAVLTLIFAAFNMHAQSYHTVTFSGNSSDFNSSEGTAADGQGVSYYITYDASNLYIAAFRTSTFGYSDNLAIYIDTDPYSTTTSGVGTTAGQSYNSVTGTLPFTANFNAHLEQGYAEMRAYGSSWANTISGYTTYLTAYARELKIPLSAIDNPKAVYITMWMGYAGGTYSFGPTGSASGSNPSISNYFGGIGLTSSGCIPVNTTNSIITDSLVNAAPASGATYSYISETSGSYTAAGNFSIAPGGSINIAGGTLSAGSYTITMGSGSTFNYSSGTFNANTSTISYLGTGYVTGTVGFNNVTIAGGVDFGASGASTINGNLQINSGGYVNNSHPPKYATNSTLIYNSNQSGGYGIFNEWYNNTTGTGAGVPYNVTIENAGLNMGSVAYPYYMNGSLNISAGTLTLSSATGGDLYLAGNWTSSGTFTTNSRAVFFNGTTQTINSPTTFAYVFIKSGSTTSIASSTSPTIANNLTINSGGTFAPGANTVNFSSGASLTNNGTFTYGTSTMSFAGSGTISGTVGLYNVTIAGGVDFSAGTTTINGTLQINGGGYAANSHSPVYATGSYLVYNTGGSYYMSYEWLAGATSGAGVPYNVTVQGSSTLNTGTSTYNATNVTISSTGTLSMSSGGTINIASGGTLTNSGTFTYGIGTINFSGSGTISGTIGFNNLTVGGAVNPGTGSTINSTLQINSGGSITANYPTYATNSYLVYNQGSTFSPGYEWQPFSSSGPGAPYNVTVQNNSILSSNLAYDFILNGSLNVVSGSDLQVSAGEIDIAGNWTDNGSSAVGDVVMFVGTSGTQTINTSNTFSDLRVTGSSTVSLATSVTPTIINNMIISSGTFSPGANTINFSSGAYFENDATFTYGTSTMNFEGSGEISGPVDFYNVTTTGALLFDDVETIHHNFLINSGGSVSSNAPTYTSSSTLIYNTGSSNTVGYEWTAGDMTPGDAGVPYNVTLQGNSGVNFGTSPSYYGLNGNLVINSGSTLALSTVSGGDIKVAGNWTDNGTFTPNVCNAWFVGSGAQTISAGESFYGLNINNASGVSTSGTVNVSNTLTLTSGTLTATTVNVTNSATGAVTGYISDPTNGSYSSSGYINGTLTRAITGTGQYDFPIGTSSNYELISIVGSSLTGTSTLTASYSTSNTGCSTPNPNSLSVSGTPIQTLLNGGYWTLTPDAEPTGGSYSVYINERGYSTPPGSAEQMTVIKRSSCSSAWQAPGTSVNSTQAFNSGTATAQMSGLTSFSNYGIGWGDYQLPVTLESFTATAKNNASVYTTWVVANQFNNKAFNIQRSANGNEFTTIGTIEGCGTCHDTRTYNLDDSKPLTGTSYYRLQQVDIDGKETYSDVVPVTISNDGIANANLYPNPTNANIWLDVTDNVNGLAIVNVSDVTGATISTQFISTQAGLTHTQLNTASLPAGVYLVTVRNTSDGSSRVLRFVKSN